MTTEEKDLVPPGKGGPGLGGAKEGIERSGPPRGMEGGDTNMMEGHPETEEANVAEEDEEQRSGCDG